MENHICRKRLYLLRKLYFGCRQSYISADAEVAVFIHNLPAAQTALLKSHCRGRQCSLLCLFAPFPHGYTVSRGVPDNCTFEIALSGAAMLTLMLVCAFSPRKYKSILRGFCNAVSLPGDASYASLLTNRLSQAAVGCLMLAYSFSPRVHSIPRGPRFGSASQ